MTDESGKINDGYDKTYILFEDEGAVLAMIYTLKSSKKDNWYYRFKIVGSGKYKKKSLRTTNQTLAIARAKELYFQLLSLSASGYDANDKAITSVWKEFLVVREENHQSNKRYEDVWNSYLKEYFNHLSVYDLNRSLMVKYWNWRKGFWHENGEGTYMWRKKYEGKVKRYALNPSLSTLRREQGILRSFIRYIKTKHLISIDEINDIKAPHPKDERGVKVGNQHKRGRFWELEDYAKFMNWLAERVESAGYIKPCNRKKPNKVSGSKKPVTVSGYYRFSNKRSWAKTQMFIYIIANTGIRVEELRNIKYSDYKLRNDGMGCFNIRYDVAKKKQGIGNRREALSFAVRKNDKGEVESCILKPLLAQFRNDYYPNATDDDYIFCSDVDNSKPADMGHMVRRALQESGFYKDEYGNKRSGTTFRHYFAQQRLIEGILPLAMLAETMGNTVTVLEQTYTATSAKPKWELLKRNADKISQSPDIMTSRACFEQNRISKALSVFKLFGGGVKAPVDLDGIDYDDLTVDKEVLTRLK